MISVITPTTRPEGVKIIEKCLRRQDFEDWEWIITSPKRIEGIEADLILQDPPKQKDDFWTLCKGWNNAYAHAKGELVVNIQDLIWFPPDTLSKFYSHYQMNPKRLIGALGHQYSGIDEYGKPQNVVWTDPRWRGDISFQAVSPSEMEMTMCSIPKKALLECGGIDEEYDKANGAQEKEMCFRLRELGWEMYLDHSIEYRAIHHGRLTSNWDEVYKAKTTPLFIRHMQELSTGQRKLNVDNLSKYLKKKSIIGESNFDSHGA